jgi:hypothetical protein
VRHGRRRRLLLLLGGGWRRRGGRHVCPGSRPRPRGEASTPERNWSRELEGGVRERSGDWSERQADGVGLIGEFHGQRPLPPFASFSALRLGVLKIKINQSISWCLPFSDRDLLQTFGALALAPRVRTYVRTTCSCFASGPSKAPARLSYGYAYALRIRSDDAAAGVKWLYVLQKQSFHLLWYSFSFSQSTKYSCRRMYFFFSIFHVVLGMTVWDSEHIPKHYQSHTYTWWHGDTATAWELGWQHFTILFYFLGHCVCEPRWAYETVVELGAIRCYEKGWWGGRKVDLLWQGQNNVGIAVFFFSSVDKESG